MYFCLRKIRLIYLNIDDIIGYNCFCLLGGYKLKILHLINYTGGGGTESYIYSLAEKLHNKNCEFFIAYSEKGNSFDKFKDLGIEMIHIPMNSPYDFKAAKKLKTICRANNIDIIHTHFLRENYISIFSKILGNQVKLINTRHMLDENSHIVKITNRIMTLFNNNIIAVSKAVERLLINELGSLEKIKLIYTGIDPDNWILKETDFRDEFKIDNETILLTSTARFSKEKGHEFLLRSISVLKENFNNKDINFKFILVGDGELLDPMIQLSKNLNIYEDIIFTGFRDDISNILNSSDIFICMSEKEAFGISIMEAMASGLPVISTDSGGTGEIITNGKTGILLDFNDIESLSISMSSLIQDRELRDFYSETGLNLIKNKFSLDQTISKTYDLYND